MSPRGQSLHSLVPKAPSNGVLVHRSTRLALSVCVSTLAPPVPSQACSLWRRRIEGRLLVWLYEATARTVLQVCDNAALAREMPRCAPSASGRAPLGWDSCAWVANMAAVG